MITAGPEEGKTIRLARGGYAYSYARVCAMRGQLIPQREYQKLLKLELNGMIRFLEETTYKRAIDALGTRFSGVELMEHALVLDMAETARKLRRITPPEVNILIDAFMGRWDVHNLKALLRGIASGADKQYVRSLFVPAGTLSQDDLDALLEAWDLTATLRAADLPADEEKRAIAACEKGDLLAAEILLDKAYYARCLDVARRLSSEGEPFRLFLREEIDTINMRTLLRLKKLKLKAADIAEHLLGDGQALTRRTLERLAALPNVEEVAAQLAKSARGYTDLFTKESTEDLVDLELAIDKRHIQRSFLFTRQSPLSVMSLLSFMLAKVTEMHNLRMLIKARQLGLDEEFIARKLVVVES